MSVFDITLTLIIIFFIIILVWSRIEQKEILDVLKEIRDFMKGDAITNG